MHHNQVCFFFVRHKPTSWWKRWWNAHPITYDVLNLTRQNVLETLRTAGMYYIRCIKPNETKRARDFEDSRYVLYTMY